MISFYVLELEVMKEGDESETVKALISSQPYMEQYWNNFLIMLMYKRTAIILAWL